MTDPKKPRPSELAPYRDAGLVRDLIPLHRWDYVDDKGRPRGKSPRDAQWRRRIYPLTEIVDNAKQGGGTGCRIPPGLIVVDFDPRNVPAGRDVIAEFELTYGVELVQYPGAKTGSDGRHWYGLAPKDLRIRNALESLPGIEFKALGRQVVCPGSIHPNGNFYEWLDGPAMKDMIEWPQALLDDLKRQESTSGGSQEEIPLPEAAGLLTKLDPTDFKDHDRWLELMMAFHSATGGNPEAREIFAEWSTSDADYADHGSSIRLRWDSLHVREGGVTVGTLYHHVVSKYGYVPPPPPEMVFEAVAPAAPGMSHVPQFDVGKDGKPKRSRKNTQEAIATVDLDVAYDEFKNRTMLRGPCTCLVRFKGIGRVWDDDIAHAMQSMFLNAMDLDVETKMIREVVRAMGLQNRFNELLEYFDGLKWDGKERMGRWLTTYAGALDTPYTRAVGQLLLLGGVARAHHPGIKFDTTIILEGRQGVGKSRLLRILGGQWTLEGLSSKLDKDDVMRMQGHLIVELGEITTLRNSELNNMKHFLSTEEDCVRPPYGTEPKVFPRRTIFVGTTNDEAYLKDMTGNRRFLPVRVKLVDHDAVERDRDQLWAEALHEWRSLVARQRERNAPLHEALYLPERLWETAAAEQEARRTEDPWEMIIEGLLEKDADGVISTQSLLEAVWGGTGAARSSSSREIQRLGRIMALFGWEKGKYRINGKSVSAFRRVGIMTPDGWVRWYYTKRADMGAPGIDLVKARGLVYAARCESTSYESRRARHGERGPCPSDVRHATKENVWVCGRCGVHWRYWERHQLRGEIQEAPRSDGFERAYGRWVDIGVLLQRLLDDPELKWQSRIFIANANGYSLRDLVKFGPTEFPEAPFQWKKWKVAEIVHAGRVEWVRRLVAAGITFDDPTFSWRHLAAAGAH